MTKDDAEITKRRNLPRYAYVFIDGAKAGERIGIIKVFESGYHLTDFDRPNINEQTARELIDRLNHRICVTAGQREAMHIGSMCGWHVPGADATRYSDDGNLIREAV